MAGSTVVLKGRGKFLGLDVPADANVEFDGRGMNIIDETYGPDNRVALLGLLNDAEMELIDRQGGKPPNSERTGDLLARATRLAADGLTIAAPVIRALHGGS
jgi:hypothetical protein